MLRAAIAFSGQLLSAEHRYLDVDDVGAEVLRQQAELCRALCALLAGRFQPGHTLPRAIRDKRFNALLAGARACEAQSHAAVLEAMLRFVGGVRLTNAYRRDRLGLAFKLERALLPPERFPQRPYGVFFFAGPQCRGFHVRFRASARGGLRILMPRNAGAYERARDGLLKEVYDLAWAQQLKNKDIPEGGSKCIALVEPGGDASAAVRQLVDALLDLILPPGQVPEVIGPHGEGRESDLIFLGPDENMTPERIVWVARRAHERGLPHDATLMSSKPGSGINHKEYGVTSEGIFRWIERVLPLAGVGEGGAYTVKMTGGPDGDVGGNLLRILHREHGARVKVLAISDGTGAAHDPAGLAWPELLRLVDESQGIAKFAPARLRGPGARVVPATDKAGEQVRNTLHNTVAADLFLPCGGRPYTINDGNWEAFLGADGKPSAKAMVEGANIFLTPTARASLERAGLVVIKDSSANKGGVICSSYEVLAGLVISDAEFLADKPRYVREVVGIIRDRADDEARALLSAWTRRGRQVGLSALSPQFSDEINRVSGLLEPAINEHLDDQAFLPHWQRHLEAHCPGLLVEKFRDRLATRIPRAAPRRHPRQAPGQPHGLQGGPDLVPDLPQAGTAVGGAVDLPHRRGAGAGHHGGAGEGGHPGPRPAAAGDDRGRPAGAGAGAVGRDRGEQLGTMHQTGGHQRDACGGLQSDDQSGVLFSSSASKTAWSPVASASSGVKTGQGVTGVSSSLPRFRSSASPCRSREA